MHGRQDGTDPLSQSASCGAAAHAAGGDAELTVVDGDHSTVIDPASAAWATQLELLADLADLDPGNRAASA